MLLTCVPLRILICFDGDILSSCHSFVLLNDNTLLSSVDLLPHPLLALSLMGGPRRGHYPQTSPFMLSSNASGQRLCLLQPFHQTHAPLDISIWMSSR